jgi:hypothetical protein
MNRWFPVTFFLPLVGCNVAAQLEGPSTPDGGSADAASPPAEAASPDDGGSHPTADASPDGGTDGGGAVSCSLGGGTVLATEAAAGPFNVALDGTSVYWTYQKIGSPDKSGFIRKVSKLGGTPLTIATGEMVPSSIVVAGGNVYWGITEPGSVRWAASDGSGAPSTFQSYSYTTYTQALIADGTTIYSGGNGDLLAMTLGGGATTHLTDGASMALALDADNVYWTAAGNPGTPYPEGVWYVAKSGGTPREIAALEDPMTMSENYPYIAADSTGIYWNTLKGDQILHVTSPTAPATTLAEIEGMGGMALDGASLYWVDGSNVLKVPVGGGATTTLASSQNGSMTIAVDDSFVYWANECGEIKKIAK